MGLFGKSKEDKAQDKVIKDLWAWITHLNKNQGILIKQHNRHAKAVPQLEKNQQAIIAHISRLDAKDKVHDEADRKFAELFQGLAQVSSETVAKEESASEG